jgi:hypothetical protein
MNSRLIFGPKMAVFFLLQGDALMMEAARTSETLVNFYQTTRRHNPEDSHLRTNRRENLKSYLIFGLFDISASCCIASD